MKVIELSGLHVGSMLRVKWKHTNKDGSYRANAVEHDWYVFPKTGIKHSLNGNVDFIGGIWFNTPPTAYLNRSTNERVWRTSGYGVYTHPDSIPYHADVEVLKP